jgi:G-patch domain/R3H domain
LNFYLKVIYSQSFPPMGKEDRKILHELAAAFGLKSKSTGSGKTRYATLVKTRRSRAFDETTWARVEQKIRRKYFPRLDNKSKGNTTGQSRSTFGSGDASVRYIDGDIVGGTAPEIAASNRGRGMLEKMGWSSGMALGSSNNGILQPIQHVVRNSRAGLG